MPLKTKDIKNMSKIEKESKIKELKIELIKAKANAIKSGKNNAKEIRKAIARIITLNK